MYKFINYEEMRNLRLNLSRLFNIKKMYKLISNNDVYTCLLNDITMLNKNVHSKSLLISEEMKLYIKDMINEEEDVKLIQNNIPYVFLYNSNKVNYNYSYYYEYEGSIINYIMYLTNSILNNDNFNIYEENLVDIVYDRIEDYKQTIYEPIKRDIIDYFKACDEEDEITEEEEPNFTIDDDGYPDGFIFDNEFDSPCYVVAINMKRGIKYPAELINLLGKTLTETTCVGHDSYICTYDGRNNVKTLYLVIFLEQLVNLSQLFYFLYYKLLLKIKNGEFYND